MSSAAEPLTREWLARVNRAAAWFFRCRLRGSWVPAYLAGRGFGPAVQDRWQAGYAPRGWDVLTRHLRALGYPAPVIQAAGLAHRSSRGTLIDTFRDRATLPLRDGRGTIAGFIGRAPGHAKPGVPKYLNSPNTGLYRKREVLFGLWEAREPLARGARPAIVEGPLDAIAVTIACSGGYAGVAPCGTALTSEHIGALGEVCDLRAAGVLVAFDPDPAGRRAAVAAFHLLCVHTDLVMSAVLPGGQDPAQILRDHGPAALAQALTSNARPLADLVVDTEVDRWRRWLCYPEGQINALHAAATLIAALPPAHVARQAARLARRLGIDYATVTAAVTDAVTDS
ncbi:MAG: toprim domain-containing protein [Micromonosporaceae bacterium]